MADLLDTQPLAPAVPAPPVQPREFATDSSHLAAAYANFARITGTPEELVLDFGLNTQMAPNSQEPVMLTHRLVVGFYTAKRLLAALHLAVEQHESVYGALETDVQKRVRQLR